MGKSPAETLGPAWTSYWHWPLHSRLRFRIRNTSSRSKTWGFCSNHQLKLSKYPSLQESSWSFWKKELATSSGNCKEWKDILIKMFFFSLPRRKNLGFLSYKILPGTLKIHRWETYFTRKGLFFTGTSFLPGLIYTTRRFYSLWFHAFLHPWLFSDPYRFVCIPKVYPLFIIYSMTVRIVPSWVALSLPQLFHALLLNQKKQSVQCCSGIHGTYGSNTNFKGWV